jgi:ribosome biogenesis SPOUT family RNA methylase Rps3
MTTTLRPTTPPYSLPIPHRPPISGEMPKKTFIVEHLDSEFETWCTLEYASIAMECALTLPSGSAEMLISGIPAGMNLPTQLRELESKGLTFENRRIEEFVSTIGQKEAEGKLWRWKKERVCLLDPKAEKELEPVDGELFDAFLFGGILGSFSLIMFG